MRASSLATWSRDFGGADGVGSVGAPSSLETDDGLGGGSIEGFVVAAKPVSGEGVLSEELQSQPIELEKVLESKFGFSGCLWIFKGESRRNLPPRAVTAVAGDLYVTASDLLPSLIAGECNTHCNDALPLLSCREQACQADGPR